MTDSVLHNGKIIAEGTESELAKNLAPSASATVRSEVLVRGDATKASRALDNLEAVSGCSVEEDSTGLL